MSKNTKLLYCILGSIILALTGIPAYYNAVNYIPVIGVYLNYLISLISSIGLILIIYFAIRLKKENCNLK